MSKLRIRHVHPDDLRPRADNPRGMDERRYAKLKDALDRFGFVEPLVVNTRTGNLVGGHQRRRAALELGITEIPIVEIDVDEDEERALNVALNNRELQGEFDPKGLVEFLRPIEQGPLLEASGFDYDQFQTLQIQAAAEALKAGREGETPPLPDTDTDTVSQPGDIIRLGRHTLVVGDATHRDAYAHLPHPADLCFTDPPYNVDYEGRTSDKLKILSDAFPTAAEYAAFLQAALTEIALATRGAVYLCHATTQAIAVRVAWAAAGYHESSTIAWVKDHFVMGRADYHWQWEPILYGWPEGRGTDRYWFGGRAQGNTWEHPTPKRGDRGRKGPSDVWRHKRPTASRHHPTMKPVALVEHALRNSSPPGGLILDPFAGSGSTIIAAENTGRSCYAVEKDPRYADVIRVRWASVADDPDDTETL